MSVTDEIKDRIDIVDLVSESVELRRAGRNYTGFCPFHHNVNTPSFVVFPDTQTWRCFSECDDGGDIFSFTMKREGWEFSEALQHLADRAGVQLKPLTPEAAEEQEENERLRALLEEAVVYYQHNLLHTDPGKIAGSYLEKRSLTENTIKTFGLGYAPDSWDSALVYFQDKGYTADELRDVGLVSERDKGGNYDRFRNRLMIPIRNRSGKMAGFGARVLDPEDVPKYLNSPQTQLFDKGKLLYGLDSARKNIRELDEVVIVEGYMGVLAAHQYGYHNTVATMGTALTDNHINIIKKYTKRIILAMDSDAAGAKATIRGIYLAHKAMDEVDKSQTGIGIDPFGMNFIGSTNKRTWKEADIHVALLPEAMDPDDVLNSDPHRWKKILNAAKPLIKHMINVLAENRNIDDPKEKIKLASEVLPFIYDIPDDIERDHYKQYLARFIKVKEETLISYLPVRTKNTRKREVLREKIRKAKDPTLRERGQRTGELYEAHCVGILLREPDLVYKVDRELGKEGLTRFDEKDFQNTDFQILVRLIKEALKQSEEEPRDYVISHIPENFLGIVDELLVRTENLDPKADKVLEDLMRAFLNLRKWQIVKSNDHLRYLQESNHENGDYKAVEYQKNITQFLQEKHKIDKAMKRYTSRTAAFNS